MNKNLILGIFLSIGSIGFGQQYAKADNFSKKNVNKNGTVTFASLKPTAQISSSDSENFLKELLKLGDHDKLVKVDSKVDKKGLLHETYIQTYNGVQVELATYKVHSKNGIITSVGGELVPITISEQISSLKPQDTVLNIGKNNLLGTVSWEASINGLNSENTKPTGELVILPAYFSKTKSSRYAYKYLITTVNPSSVQYVYLDAINGELLHLDSAIKDGYKVSNRSQTLEENQEAYLAHLKNKKAENLKKIASEFAFDGSAETRYSGTRTIQTEQTDAGYVLLNNTDSIYTKNVNKTDYLILVLFGTIMGFDYVYQNNSVDFVDNDNNWTTAEHSENKDNAALDVHWGIHNVKDYFFTKYGRNSFDDQGTKIISYVHTGENYVNAAWVDAGKFMIYGDGNYVESAGTGLYDALVSLDVTAHELGHAVNFSTAVMAYQRESGALNEGLSDVWGAIIEKTYAPEKLEWIIGEDLYLGTPDGIRSLENPKIFSQPNTYLGEYWEDASENCTPNQNNDQCGVHTNSGVLNYWYYLASVGGSGTNDNDFDYNVVGMGDQLLADIVYDVEANYAGANTTYSEFKDFTLESATQTYGVDSNQYKSILDAWCAVGVETGDACLELKNTEISLENFSIYPNPTSDILYVSTKKSFEKTTYKISNTAGQLLDNGAVIGGKIYVSKLPKGVYVISFDGDGKKQNIKFIKK